MGVLLCPWEFKTQHARQWWWSVNVQRWLKAHDFQGEPEILSYNINIKYYPRTSQCHSSSVVSKALWGNSVMTPETRLKDGLTKILCFAQQLRLLFCLWTNLKVVQQNFGVFQRMVLLQAEHLPVKEGKASETVGSASVSQRDLKRTTNHSSNAGPSA